MSDFDQKTPQTDAIADPVAAANAATQRMNRVGIATFIVVAVALTIRAFLPNQEPNLPVEDAAVAAATAAVDAAATAAPVTFTDEQLEYTERLLKEPNYEAARALVMASGSIKNTTPDGEVNCQLDGTLKPTRSTRRSFDYWLSALGDAARDEIRVVMLNKQAENFGKHCILDTARVFDLYTTAQKASADSPELKLLMGGKTADGKTPSLEQRRAALMLLRSARIQIMGEQWHAAFYKDEENEWLDGYLGAASGVTPTASATRSSSQSDPTIVAGYPDIERVRASQGDDAAARLQAVIDQQKEWDGRIAALKTRVQIIRQSSQTAAEKTMLIEQDIQHNFSSSEQVRANALAQNF